MTTPPMDPLIAQIKNIVHNAHTDAAAVEQSKKRFWWRRTQASSLSTEIIYRTALDDILKLVMHRQLDDALGLVRQYRRDDDELLEEG
jgi:hypothetical protein